VTDSKSVNKHVFTYHGQKSTASFRYRPAKIGGRETRTIRATQTEQGVAGSRWISKYSRTSVNAPAGSHRPSHVMGKQVRGAKKNSLGKSAPFASRGGAQSHVSGPFTRG
jgi:hypothetical protein